MRSDSPRLRAVALALALLGTAQLAQAASLIEGFDDLPGIAATGWISKNNSSNPNMPWGLGDPAVFPAATGDEDSYVSAGTESVEPIGVLGTVTISQWLITPTLTFNNGDVLSFQTRTRTESAFPDRLEVRFSSVGGRDVGTTPESVGTFTSLLVSINPTLAVGGYPEVWTTYRATITGLSSPSQGAIGFRYYVTDGGRYNGNSDYIGLDDVRITDVSALPVPEPATWLLLAAGGGMLLAAHRRRSRHMAD
jgi:hypothetical protein